jgi:hypothetical protein
LHRLWHALFGQHRSIRDLPPPDPEIRELHERQHQAINDLQRHRLWVIEHRQDMKRRPQDG